MLTADLNRSRTIGVEHEFTIPRIGDGDGMSVQRSIAAVLSANGLRSIARPYSHDPVPNGYDLAVEYDSSVRGESRYSGISWHPVEMKSRILRGIDDWESVIPRALEICRYLGGRINPSCGHHIHLGLPEIKRQPVVIRSLFNAIAKFEPLIFGFVAASRKENTYCSMLDGANVKLLNKCKTIQCFEEALSRAGLGSRHCGTNWTHLSATPPRVEFRYHHGTLDPVKARHWLRTVMRLVDHSVQRRAQSSDQLSNSKETLERFLTSLGFKSVTGIYKVSPELKETGRYLRKRWAAFNTPDAADRDQEGEGR